MAKRITVVVEGNTRQEDRTVHELNKLVDKADSQPELQATMQSETVQDSENEATFERAGGDDD